MGQIKKKSTIKCAICGSPDVAGMKKVDHGWHDSAGSWTCNFVYEFRCKKHMEW